MIDLKAAWASLSPKAKAQVARLVRLTVVAAAPLLFAAYHDPKGLTWKIVGALLVGSAETAWRHRADPPDAG